MLNMEFERVHTESEAASITCITKTLACAREIALLRKGTSPAAIMEVLL